MVDYNNITGGSVLATVADGLQVVEKLDPNRLLLTAGYYLLDPDTQELLNEIVKQIEEVREELHVDKVELNFDKLTQGQKEEVNEEVSKFNSLPEGTEEEKAAKLEAFAQIDNPAARVKIFKEAVGDKANPEKAAELFKAELKINPRDRDVILAMFKEATPEQRRLMLIDAMNDMQDLEKQKELQGLLDLMLDENSLDGVDPKEQTQAMIGITGGIMQLAMGEPKGALTILKGVAKFVFGMQQGSLDAKGKSGIVFELLKDMQQGGFEAKSAVRLLHDPKVISQGGVVMSAFQEGFKEFAKKLSASQEGSELKQAEHDARNSLDDIIGAAADGLRKHAKGPAEDACLGGGVVATSARSPGGVKGNSFVTSM